MLTDETRKALQDFAKAVIRESKRNLTRNKKNASKSLHKSLDYDLEVGKNSFSLSFLMEQYGVYQDRGVSGTKKKYNTPFSYKDKMPPSKVFDKWLIRKGIAPRDKKGKFVSRKSMSFLIARKIYRFGIKPTMFFTKPFEKYYEQLPEQLIFNFDLDIDKLLNHSLKDFK